MTAKFIKPGNAAFTITNQVEGDNIEFFRFRVQVRHRQVLKEQRQVPQMQQSQSLTSHAQRPVVEAAFMHLGGGASPCGIEYGNFQTDLVGVLLLPELDQVGHQGMQTINGCEFLRKIEGRAEMVGAAIDIIFEVSQIPAIMFPPEHPLGLLCCRDRKYRHRMRAPSRWSWLYRHPTNSKTSRPLFRRSG